MNQSKFGLTRAQPTRQETRPDANQLPKMFVDVQGGGGSKVNEKEEKAPSVCVLHSWGCVRQLSGFISPATTRSSSSDPLFLFHFKNLFLFCFLPSFVFTFSYSVGPSEREDGPPTPPAQDKEENSTFGRVRRSSIGDPS